LNGTAMDGRNLKLTPRNWTRFQHYNSRRPPWIKLHRSLLDDYHFHTLPIASRAIAPMLWLLASEQQDGIIEAEPAALAFRLRISEKDLVCGLKPLIDNGFFESASTMLAPCKQNGVSETETETETEKPPFIPPKAPAKAERKKPGTRLPEDWAYDLKHEVIAQECGVSLYDEFVKFKDFFIGEGRVKADWNRTFSNWLRTAGERRSRTSTWSRK